MDKIKCDNCQKLYEEKEVFSRFTYNFNEGVFFLKGKNGCGKSTLLRVLTGIEKPTSGKVERNVKNILFLTNEGIGQNFLTIKENIELMLSLHKLKVDRLEECLTKLYDQTQLETLYENSSLGMTLKVGCTLLFKEYYWDLIIIDETFSGIDKESQQVLLDQLYRLTQVGEVCVIITSHNDVLDSYKGPYKIIDLSVQEGNL